MSTLTTQTKVLTNAILKGILSDAMLDRGHLNDIDTCITPGFYYCAPACVGLPSYLTGVFYLAFIAKAGDIVTQVLFPESRAVPIHYRTASNQVGIATARWKKIDFSFVD